ncbi:MAG: FAD-dependent oxidoreductase [Mycobacteriales bacterium]
MDLHWLDGADVVDVLVIGAGVTGAGVALDAASRGLSVVLIDKHDLAFGTSRWSSKLVHGGLRYLASGQVGIARESAAERGILMTRTAPHLVHALPSLLPLLPPVTRRQAAIAHTGYVLGDLLRMSVRTPSAVLPRMRRLTGTETAHLVPAVTRRGLRGGLLAWDGQLVDDARLVVTIARTAAGHGARVITRCAAENVAGDGALVRDRLTGESHEIRARAVVNATGVWAGDLVPEIRIRPSRGTHLILSGDSLRGAAGVQLTVPVAGETNRFVIALPQADGRVYVGLTDEPFDGPIPDVPQPTEPEIQFLLTSLNGVLTEPVDRGEVLGAFAGLRPLLHRAGGTGPVETADLSRRHAVLTSGSGVITVVGGKLTTYRRMAQDAVDAAVLAGRIAAGPCVTKNLPLVGAAGPATLARLNAPPRLVARYGTLASDVLAEASADPAWLEPVAEGVQTTLAELRHAVRHEGALDEGDLLDRRTRLGLVDTDRARAEDAARLVLSHPD